MPDQTFRRIASAVAAYRNCLASETASIEWEQRHRAAACTIVENDGPRGSGFDAGTQIDMEASTGERLVFTTAYHHMSEHGYYQTWTDHRVTVRPSLVHGFTITVSGPNRNGIKDYIAETFEHWLSSPADSDAWSRAYGVEPESVA